MVVALLSHSLVLLSDVVVLCNEQSVVAPADWDGNTRVRCQVVQAFKGGLAPGARFGIVYDALYSRALPGDEGYTLMNAHHQVERVGLPRTFPPDAPCSSSSATPGLPPTPS